MSLLPSRGVSGARLQRHSISFNTDVWSYTRELIRGLVAVPAVHGDATTTGSRSPSSVLPFTMSVSTLFAAVARGGATCSKNPPHSSKLKTITVLDQAGPFATASKTSCRNTSPLRISACGWAGLVQYE